MYLSYRYKLERYITCIKLWKKNYYCCKFESRKNKLHILQKLIKKRIISIEFIFILFLQNSNTHNFIWKLLLLKMTFLRIILYRMFIQIETRIRRRWKEKLNRRIVFFLPCNETMHSHRTTNVFKRIVCITLLTSRFFPTSQCQVGRIRASGSSK